MKSRCLNPKNTNYHYYGGRGITVCQRWLDSFENFLEDMGECPENLVLDRIDNNGNYEPGNCRWTTYKISILNRRNTIWIEYNENTYCLSDFARFLGISFDQLWRWYVAEKRTIKEIVKRIEKNNRQRQLREAYFIGN